MLNLPNVTLFATCGPNLALTIDSFEKCLAQAKFGDAIFFTETEINEPKPYRVIKIDPVGSANGSGIHYFLNLPPLMKTSHMLVVDWDAWIIHPECWTDHFLEYDYIGAKWPWLPSDQNIGNGGFALMSKKLLVTVTELPVFSESKGLDVEIGQIWRPELERDHGIRFPSGDTADRFSYETEFPEKPSFGFHAVFNMWRHVSDDEMIRIIKALSASSVKKSCYAHALRGYYKRGKFRMAIAMYKRLSECVSDPMAHLAQWFPLPRLCLTIRQPWEKLNRLFSRRK